jgi:hypothetical protein
MSSSRLSLFVEGVADSPQVAWRHALTNGDLTTLSLPGDIVVSFSGHDVRDADGRQLQRVGLVPHIDVRPTIKGIRGGRGEVLERVRNFLPETIAQVGKRKVA